MDKYFICLANSYKHGGRCLAGIEIAFNADGKHYIMRHDDGRPIWVRPISNQPDGSIPTAIAQQIKLFDVVKMTDAVPCPDKAHVEDTKYATLDCNQGHYTLSDALLKLCIDSKHQNVFYFRGKAIPAKMVDRLDYSLMLIKPEEAHAYIDEDREKSKYRMKFTYYGSHYDFPITDPVFLEAFKKEPELYANLQGVYLTLSLGLEFEGFHFKLVAAVILTEEPKIVSSVASDTSGEVEELSYMEKQKLRYPNAYAKWSEEDDALLMELQAQGLTVGELAREFNRNMGAIQSRLKKLKNEEESWFEVYEQQLARLIEQKKDIETQIEELRRNLVEQMELHGEEKVSSERFIVTYQPPRTVMQFDGKAFREENQALYERYCKPKKREAMIVVRRNKADE